MSSPALRRVSLVAVLALTGIGTLSLTGVSRADSGAGNSFTPYVVTDGSKTVNGGEPSLGVDPKTNAVVYGAGGHETQMTFDDSASPATVTQKDVSAPTAVTTLDAITFVDQHTGRLFDSQLLGLCSGMSYSDDDGASWQPTTGCGQNTFLDHQSVGGGPFHAPIPAGADPLYPDAVYYCAQNGFNATCAVSLDGGLTFGPGQYISNTPANDVNDPNQQFAAEGGACTGLHGHVKVGPDGTVYVPLKNCGGQPTVNNLTNEEYFGGEASVSVSEDNGTTYTIHMVPGSHSQDETDNAVDTDKAGRLYMAWQDGTYGGDGTNDSVLGTTSEAKTAYSDDNGKSWSKPYDLSSAFGVQNVQFAEIVGGDKGRAAVAFLGTNAIGDDQHNGFNGPNGKPAVWDLYVSMTDDGGQTWNTYDTTPNDPVQRGCVDMQGTSNKTVLDNNICSQRNLLDFNDMTMDSHGRVLVAYADGCVGTCVTDPTVKSKSDVDMVMRQSTGTGLLTAYDGTLGGAVGADLPEAPIAVLAPLAAACVLGMATLRRRRAALRR